MSGSRSRSLAAARRCAAALALCAGCSLAVANLADSERDGGFACRRRAGPLVIDGAADEPAWAAAQVIDSFSAAWAAGETDELTPMQARLLWDDAALYFLADLRDDELVIATTVDDGRLWLGDVFELFFKPRAGDPGYYEFQVNPANARLDMYLPRRSADAYQRWRAAREFSWVTAVQRTAVGWAVEGKIPWRDFGPSGGAPRAGERWRFALCRYDYDRASPPRLSSNAALTRPDFHRHREWPMLHFVAR